MCCSGFLNPPCHRMSLKSYPEECLSYIHVTESFQQVFQCRLARKQLFRTRFYVPKANPHQYTTFQLKSL